MKKVLFLVFVGAFSFGVSAFASCREVTCESSCGTQLEVTNGCKAEKGCSATKACIPKSSVFPDCLGFNSQCSASCGMADDPACAAIACPAGMKYCKASSGGGGGGGGTKTCASSCPSGKTCSCLGDGQSCSGSPVSGTFSDCDAASGYTCCAKDSSGGGGGGSGAAPVKCDPKKFKEYAGVCFPLNTGLAETSVTDIVVNLMKWVLYLFGFLAIIAFVVSGIQYLVAAGNMNQIETAKRNMKFSILGVIVALSGLVIILAVDALLKGTAWGS